jgi:hypothetical protein
MSTQYCSYSVLPPKGKRTTSRRSCKKTDNASENSDLCEVLNNRCGLKVNHARRVSTHDHPKTSKGRTGKKAVRRSTQKAAPKPLEPPAPDAKLSAFLENATRRAAVPTRAIDVDEDFGCVQRSQDDCENKLPKVCRWDQGRLKGKGQCVRGENQRIRDERTDLFDKAEESYLKDRADKVGKVVPNPKRK